MQEILRVFEYFMFFLFFFAFVNIVSGLFFRKKVRNQKLSYFFEMNFFWNLVNIVIAVLALYQGLSIRDAASNLVAEYIQSSKNIICFNIYLDLFYMVTAIFIMYLGYKRNSNRLTGYSFSVLFQGAFLFLLDVAIYMQIVSRGF